jgi:hypothetical protein
VNCIDKAGNQFRSFGLIEILVDIGRTVNIFNLTPENDIIINETELLISFNTDEYAQCTIDEDTSGQTWWDQLLDLIEAPEFIESENSSGYYTYQYLVRNLTDSYGDLDDYLGYKLYGYEIVCEDPDDIFFPSLETRRFKVDITPPEININYSLYEGVFNHSNITFSFSTENESQNIMISVNGVMQHDLDILDPEYDYSTGMVDSIIYLANGTNDVQIEVKDKAGNVNRASLDIEFNNKGPSIIRVIPDKGIFRNVQAFDSSIRAYLFKNIEDINISYSEIIVMNSSKHIISMNKIEDMDPDSWVLNYTLVDIPNGEYSILVKTFDMNGTAGEMIYKRFVIDKNASLIDLYFGDGNEFDLDNV